MERLELSNGNMYFMLTFYFSIYYSMFSKVFEKLTQKELNIYVNKLLSAFFCGYRKGNSTQFALMTLTH